MSITRHLSNMPGRRFAQRYVVIESDDWGSIRMPSKSVLEKMKLKGYSFKQGDGERYSENDTLASANDMSALFDTLLKVKDKTGNNPVFTALTLVANPDFEKIENDSFNNYYYEPFTKTLERYGRSDAFELWKSGFNEKLFVPEFHGREHLNVFTWMNALRDRDKPTLDAFEHGFWAIKTSYSNVNFQAAFNLNDLEKEIVVQQDVINTGLKLFEEIHGRKAEYMVPPNGYFSRQLEETTSKLGIKFLCTEKVKKEPKGNSQFKKSFHYIGQRNRWNQVYITRNAFFEPNDKSKDWVDTCLNDISIAFKWRKPAVISTHRTNYIGGLNAGNRDYGLKELNRLLVSIMKKWPDVEFISSKQLGDQLSVKSNEK